MSAKITEADLRIALNLTVRESLWHVATGLSLLYFVFAVSHMLTLPKPAAAWMSLVAGTTAVSMFGLRVLLRRRQIPHGWAHPIMSMIAGLVLLNSLLHLYFTFEPQQTTNLLLLVVGSGLLFLSRRWLGLIILATLTGWGIIVWMAPASPNWVHFGFALGSASVLAMLVHGARVHTLRRLESLRVQDRHRTEELAVAVAVNEATTFEHAIQITLSRVCALTGWPAGHAYVPKEGTSKELIPTNVWHSRSGESYQALRQATTGARLASGTALADWVCSTQKPLWLADVTTDPVFSRTGLAEELGITSAFAFPVSDGTELLAVLEFFSDSAMPTDESRLEVLADICAHVGRVIRRHRAEAALRDSEAALRESEEKYRLLVEHTEMPITLYDTEGRLIFINHVGAENLGSTPDALLGKSIHDLFPQPEADTYLTRIQKIIASGSGNRYEDSIKLMAGERWFWSNLQAIKDESGKPMGVQIISQDVTERKKAEQQLVQAKQIAEQSTKALERFLANMSHEIRTPMNAVVGMAHLLQETELNLEQKEFLQALRSASHHLLGIVNDILDFSKIEAGAITFEQIEFNLDEIIQDTIQTLQFKAREKNLEVLVETAAGIPDVLIGDPFRLKQILINLVSNAIKFTATGRVSIRTSPLAADAHGASLLFTVADTGIGIPAEHLNLIFESFAQSESPGERRLGGTGLGLTIAKQLVEKQGGTITVESEVGKGSIFRVNLRFGIARAAFPSLHPRQPGKGQDQSLFGINILLVEDDKLSQMLTAKLVGEWGASIDVADNGRIAIAKMAQHTYDLVLLDIQLPEMDGYETADYIRHEMAEAMREIPILAMTASASTATLENILGHGMNDFITKPFKPEILSAKITSLVNEHRRNWRPAQL